MARNLQILCCWLLSLHICKLPESDYVAFRVSEVRGKTKVANWRFGRDDLATVLLNVRSCLVNVVDAYVDDGVVDWVAPFHHSAVYCTRFLRNTSYSHPIGLNRSNLRVMHLRNFIHLPTKNHLVESPSSLGVVSRDLEEYDLIQIPSILPSIVAPKSLMLMRCDVITYEVFAV